MRVRPVISFDPTAFTTSVTAAILGVKFFGAWWLIIPAFAFLVAAAPYLMGGKGDDE